MAAGSIRTATAQAVIATATAATDMLDVECALSYPGDESGRDAIWLDAIDGASEVPTSRAGRSYRDDTFRLTWQIRTTDHDDATSAMGRVEQLAAAIDGMIADDPTLGGLDGLLWASFAGLTRGPLPVQTPTGVIGYGEVVVECHSRLN